jgi:hypothetical protein
MIRGKHSVSEILSILYKVLNLLIDANRSDWRASSYYLFNLAVKIRVA